ncbi:MAG: hypothetical protein GYB64_12525 [Chloroflexi bacterium]|nr:hypothetical protein [Chloroflexota bacterium]
MLDETIIENEEWRWVFISGAILLVLLTIPFIWAYAVSGERTFVGVLVTPIDGVSYLAKMYQGRTGDWLFELPYTPEPHRGVFVYAFYLSLGKLAGLLNIDIAQIFHAARLVGGMLLFVAIYRFVSRWTTDVGQRRLAWGLAVMGAGFGWLALIIRGDPVPLDILRLPEAFPFQAIFTNPHFPLSIAVALLVADVLLDVLFVHNDLRPQLGVRTAALAGGAAFLMLVSPFILLPVGLGFGLAVIWMGIQRREIPWRELSWGSVVAIFALPFLIYNLWAISAANPVFAGWMAQNSTPSPPVWEYLIAFGPLLILAGIGLWRSRSALHYEDLVLIGWLLSTLILLYAPLGLQRRFAIGLTIPLAIYSARAIRRVILPAVGRGLRPVLITVIFLTFIPSSIIALILPMVGALSPEGERAYYLTPQETEALAWMQQTVDEDAVVLASPDYSLFIPTVGRTVVYGHPFETLRAEPREQAVLDYYAGTDCSVIDDESVDYVVIGPREQHIIEASTCLPESDAVYQTGSLMIYAVDDAP